METASWSFYFALFLLFSCSSAFHKSPNNSVPAVYVFGDSTSDPGNNNYILTAFTSNFPPYGRDLPTNVPARRFTNGGLTSDFVAEYVGVKKYIPPYLDPTLSTNELTSGVSFTSAGSGYDPLTTIISGVIPMERQLSYFREYKRRVRAVVGKEKMDRLINKSLFLVGAGTNDFVLNYFTLQVRRAQYNVVEYQLFLLKYVEKFIKALWEEGARKIAVAGLPPMGYLPLVITTNSSNTVLLLGCIENLNTVSMNYNQLLQERLKSILLGLADHTMKIGYVDIFSPLAYMINNPARFGIEQVGSGCCGTGYIEVSFLCNPGSYVCPDASKYTFWDSIHPTQATYYHVFLSMCPVVDFLISS